jgi:hypothetical protein
MTCTDLSREYLEKLEQSWLIVQRVDKIRHSSVGRDFFSANCPQKSVTVYLLLFCQYQL